jgi:hypothetical protein
VIRRASLELIGGIPTGSVTEDILTTLALLRHGYVTRYLNEKLALGLSAESLKAFSCSVSAGAVAGCSSCSCATARSGPVSIR